MSNLRPAPIILAACPNEKVARRLSLSYGVYSKVVEVNDNDMDEAVLNSKKVAKDFFDLKENDIVIITGGIHEKPHVKQTNFLKIEQI